MTQYEFHELANIFPLMNGKEYDDLVNDIKANGLIEPVMLSDNKIIDGRNRYRACSDAGIECEFNELKYQTFSQLISFVVSKNLHRRHLESGQRAACVADANDIINKLKEEARQRQATSEQGIYGGKPLSQKIDEPVDMGRTDDKLAELFNTNRQYVSDAIKIKEQRPDLHEKVKSGEIKIADAKREIKRDEVISSLESIEVKEQKEILGLYDVIVIDPPWPMQKIERDVTPNQVLLDYPVMSINEIESFELPCAENCHVWLWTTQKFLPDAFEILQMWELKYVCTFVWHKAGGFQPFNLPQYNCEFVLYARKGTPEFIDLKDFKVCFDAPRGKHSEKPDEFYDVIKRVTAGRRIDIFNRRPIDGFDVWGKETQNE